MNRATTLLVAFSMAGCGVGNEMGADDPGTSVEESAAAPTLLVSADFASTSKTEAIVRSELTTNPAAQLVAVGDLAYSSPYAANYPWASWKARTFPIMGNHEFNSVAGTGGQEPFALFNGANAAGNHIFPAITGANGVATYDFFYSYQVAPGWLLVAVNSGTACKQQTCTGQATRLTTAISDWRTANGGHGCVIVALHTARWSTLFSSSTDNLPWAPTVDPIWRAAVAEHADIVLQGHAHVYEEFVKLGAAGAQASDGAKLFTVGAGGRGQVTPTQSNISTSERVVGIKSPVNGVLKLALYNGSYGYHFETAATSGTPASSVACNVP